MAGLEMLRTHGTPIERIVAGRTFYEARDWLVPAFEELSKKLTPPTQEEGRLLGVKDVLNLWYIQSYRRSNSYDEHVNIFIRHLILENGSLENLPVTISSVRIFG